MIACFVVFLLMSLYQHEILQKNQQQKRLQLPAIPAPTQYRYRCPIPYNPIARFTFVGMPDVLCYQKRGRNRLSAYSGGVCIESIQINWIILV